MPAPKLSIEETLEQQRTRLEGLRDKLQKALRVWQTYSAEYEGFKEELQELPENASREDMIEAGYNFGGTVVDSAEVLTLLGDKEKIKRSRNQVIDAINHRITYVTDNIKQVETQLEKNQEKLQSLLVVQGPEVLNEDGEPVVEIREELDEEGNVISSSQHPHGKGTATAINVDDVKQLQKYLDGAIEEAKTLTPPATGNATSSSERIIEISEDPSAEKSTVTKENSVTKSENSTSEVSTKPATKPSNTHQETKKPQTEAETAEAAQKPLTASQNVTEKGTTETSNSNGSEISEKSAKSSNATVESANGTQTSASQPATLSTPDAIPKKTPKVEEIQECPVDGPEPKLTEEDFVLSVDEPEDAADLRRQMIDYNLHDIGAVVAELELEEDYDDDDDYDDEDDDDEDEDEDQYGRTRTRVITEDIEQEMQALQARIRERQEAEKAKGMAAQPKMELQHAAQITIAKDEPEPEPKKKKGVTFAEKVEVKSIPPAPKVQRPPPPQLPAPPPRQDFILPPEPVLDPDDAVPFLVDLLAREQMIEDMNKAGINTAGNPKGPVVQNDGWAVKVKDEAESKQKKPSIFKATRASTSDTDPKAEAKSHALKDTIIERAAGSEPTAVAPPDDKPKKVSRFKAAKANPGAASISALTEPSVGIYQNSFAENYNKSAKDEEEEEKASKEGVKRPLVAPTIIEKPPTVVATPPGVDPELPAAPSELDPALQMQEVSVEYYKTRNKMIQREGGFLPREEEEMFVPVDDKPQKKVSRFKAARLGAGGVQK